MNKIEKWVQDFKVFHVPIEELIEYIQVDAYNSALQEVQKKATLKSTTNGVTKKEGKSVQTYIPGRGVRTIEIDFSSIKQLRMKEDEVQSKKTKC